MVHQCPGRLLILLHAFAQGYWMKGSLWIQLHLVLVQLQSTGRPFAAGGCGRLDTGGMFGYVFHYIHVTLLLCMHLPMVSPKCVPRLEQMMVLVLSPLDV